VNYAGDKFNFRQADETDPRGSGLVCLHVVFSCLTEFQDWKKPNHLTEPPGHSSAFSSWLSAEMPDVASYKIINIHEFIK